MTFNNDLFDKSVIDLSLSVIDFSVRFQRRPLNCDFDLPKISKFTAEEKIFNNKQSQHS